MKSFFFMFGAEASAQHLHRPGVLVVVEQQLHVHAAVAGGDQRLGHRDPVEGVQRDPDDRALAGVVDRVHDLALDPQPGVPAAARVVEVGAGRHVVAAALALALRRGRCVAPRRCGRMPTARRTTTRRPAPPPHRRGGRATDGHDEDRRHRGGHQGRDLLHCILSTGDFLSHKRTRGTFRRFALPGAFCGRSNRHPDIASTAVSPGPARRARRGRLRAELGNTRVTGASRTGRHGRRRRRNT